MVIAWRFAVCVASATALMCTHVLVYGDHYQLSRTVCGAELLVAARVSESDLNEHARRGSAHSLSGARSERSITPAVIIICDVDTV